MKKVKSDNSSISLKRRDIRFYPEWSHILIVYFLMVLSLAASQSLALAQDTEAMLSTEMPGVSGEGNNAPDEGFYLVGPPDILSISVWKDELLSRDATVRPDGRISFPLIGDVVAEGRHVAQIAQEINERLTKFVSDPRVTVGVTEVKSYRIFVIGKVARPGEFLLGQHTDVMQALSLAGGITPFARESSIRILRRIGDQQKVHTFDYSEVLEGRNLEQNIILRRGDVVMVP